MESDALSSRSSIPHWDYQKGVPINHPIQQEPEKNNQLPISHPIYPSTTIGITHIHTCHQTPSNLGGTVIWLLPLGTAVPKVHQLRTIPFLSRSKR